MVTKKIVSVIGDAFVEVGSPRYELAFKVGKALVDNGYRVQTGGLNGVMAAASAGAKSSEKYKEGDVIALVPSFDSETANEFADIVIPTGLDVFRNVIVANAYAVIAVGGGAGTLCEMANAWSLKRLLIGMCGTGGWSEKLAGQKLDERVRYENMPDDCVFGAYTAEEAVAVLNEKIGLYTARHTGIPYRRQL